MSIKAMCPTDPGTVWKTIIPVMNGSTGSGRVYSAADPLDDETASFRELMDEIYPHLAKLSSEKPIVLLEFGATNGNPRVNQAAWARSALAEITSGRWPRVIGFACGMIGGKTLTSTPVKFCYPGKTTKAWKPKPWLHTAHMAGNTTQQLRGSDPSPSAHHQLYSRFRQVP